MQAMFDHDDNLKYLNDSLCGKPKLMYYVSVIANYLSLKQNFDNAHLNAIHINNNHL